MAVRGEKTLSKDFIDPARVSEDGPTRTGSRRAETGKHHPARTLIREVRVLVEERDVPLELTRDTGLTTLGRRRCRRPATGSVVLSRGRGDAGGTDRVPLLALKLEISLLSCSRLSLLLTIVLNTSTDSRESQTSRGGRDTCTCNTTSSRSSTRRSSSRSSGSRRSGRSGGCSSSTGTTRRSGCSRQSGEGNRIKSTSGYGDP